MAKGWTAVGTSETIKAEKKAENVKRMRKFDNVIKHTKTLSYEDLQKENENLFKKQEAENAQLLQAYADKKLKSKELIKKARGLKKRKNAAAGK